MPTTASRTSGASTNGRASRAVIMVLVGIASVAGLGWARATHTEDVSPQGRLRAVRVAMAGGDVAALRALVPAATDAQARAVVGGDHIAAVRTVGESTTMYAATIASRPGGGPSPVQVFLQPDPSPGPLDELLGVTPWLVSLGAG